MLQELTTALELIEKIRSSMNSTERPHQDPFVVFIRNIFQNALIFDSNQFE
jgi:hypothetical protein